MTTNLFLGTSANSAAVTSIRAHSARQQHKPGINQQIMGLICSGVTMRRTAKLVGVAKRTLVKKVQWLADEARKAHAKFLANPPEKTSFV